jgi:hypothetical protein
MELTETQSAALAAIVDASLAWSRAADLMARGHSGETLDELRELGLIEPWTLPVGLCWTLTAYGAFAAKVELHETERGESPHWVRAGTDPPPAHGHPDSRVRSLSMRVMATFAAPPVKRREPDEPQPYLDPVTGDPMTLIGVPVYQWNPPKAG